MKTISSDNARDTTREHPAADALAGRPSRFFQMNLGHAPERPSLAKVASEAYVFPRERDRRVCGGLVSPAARDLPAPPPGPAADKAAPLLPARPDQALHKAPHFRPAPARSRRPHASRTHGGLRLRDRRAPARAGTACGSATDSAQTTFACGRPLGPRCLPLASPRRDHRHRRCCADTAAHNLTSARRAPARGRARHVTQLRARAPRGLREMPGCWDARLG